MGPVSAEITIDAPGERVFEIVSDLAKRPSFCDHFQDPFRLQRIDPTGIGAAARYQLPHFPGWVETVIDEIEAPYLLIERGKGSRFDRMAIGTAWELVPNGGTMTDVTVSFWTDPSHPVDKLKSKFHRSGWYERQWDRALKRLRDLVESGVEVEPLQVAGASHP